MGGALMRGAAQLAGCRRGSMAVEVIVLVPLFVLLWQIANILHGLNVEAIHATGETRSCAWRYALRGCRSIPSGCRISSHGEVDGGDLEAAAHDGFATVGDHLPFLSGTLRSLHGEVIEARRDDMVSASPLWRDIPVHAQHSVMCNTPTLEWLEPDVVSETCRALNGWWCP